MTVRCARGVVILLLMSGPVTVYAQSVDATVPPAKAQRCPEGTATGAGDPPATASDDQTGCPPPATPADATPPSSPKRILGVIPNFTTDDTFANRASLKPHQKFALALDQTFDISAHLGNLLQAGIEQATNGQPHYTSGSFGKRFGAAEVDQITSCLFIYGVLPAVLHSDPRYFRYADGAPAARAWYAISRTFVSRNDAGANVLNTSQLAGQLTQAGLSNLYYPPPDRTLGGTMTNWTIQLAYNSAFNVLKEFYPDLLAKLHHHALVP